MKRKVLILLCSFMLSALFIYSGFSQLFDFNDFEQSIYQQPLKKWMILLLIYLLPLVEIIIAIVLMIDAFRVRGFVASGLLLLIFSSYISLILVNFFHRVPCACAGVIRNFTWKEHLFFNLLFLLVAVSGFILDRRHNKIFHARNQV